MTDRHITSGRISATFGKLTKKNAYTFLLVLIAVTLPTKWMQLNSILILCLTALYLFDADLTSRIKSVIKMPMFFALASIFILYVISLLYTADLANGMSHLETRFSIFVFPLIILSYYPIDRKMIRIVLISFMASTLFFSLLCLLHTIYINQINGIEYVYYNSWHYSADSLVKTYGFHPSYFSIYIGFCVFIALYLYNEKVLKWYVVAVVIIYLFFFQLLLAARGGILATLFVFVLTILYQAHSRRKLWLGVIIISMLIISMVYAVTQFTIITDKFKGMFNYGIHEYNERFKLTRRFEKWESAVTLFQRHPLLGLGVGDSREELQKIYLEKGFRDAYNNRYDAHNLFLETAISVGIFGVATLLVLFGVSFYVAFKNRNPLYLQFLILFLLLSLPEATFSIQKGIVFFAFFNTIFICNLTLGTNRD